MSVLFDFIFVLSALNMWTSVFCLKFNGSEKKNSIFRELGLFIFLNVLTAIGLFPVSPSVLDNIIDSIMVLYWCFSSYFLADLNKFLIFYKHLCSYIALLLNDWLTPMVTICCFSHSDRNNPLIMTHWCSNEWISII